MRLLGIFKRPKPIIAVIHLQSPRRLSEEKVVRIAAEEARVFWELGVDGVLVENFGDRPYVKVRVPSHVRAVIAKAVKAVRSVFDGPVGVNVLRNDLLTALEVDREVGIDFIRVNYLVGVAVTPEGMIEGAAHYLREAAERPPILADILTKHGDMLYPRTVEEAVRETVERGMADALVVTGEATGKPPSLTLVGEAKRRARVPVFVGSGLNPRNVFTYLLVADGGIVSSYFRRGGVAGEPLEPQRVAEFMSSVRELRSLVS
ncbi:phosphorybosylanthranilate isomerase [Candidatus Geothermarchaeota archaeon ex4572_27]|nr:MAG: phosphorybosylanthranilate isomerase [Candidatus Geothermarchaeota archaeon ex4572_27]